MNLAACILLSLSLIPGPDPGSLDVRREFHTSFFSEEKLLVFIRANDMPETNQTLAYKGLGRAMMAEHVFSPWTKYKCFTEGRDMVEKAIDDEPANAELRYIRLLLQLNTPPILGYDENVDEDFDMLTRAFKDGSIEDVWRETFVQNLLQGQHLDEKHLKILQDYSKSARK